MPWQAGWLAGRQAASQQASSNHGARFLGAAVSSFPPLALPLSLSAEAIYVSAYPTAWQLQAMCEPWQHQSSYSLNQHQSVLVGTNTTQRRQEQQQQECSTYQVIKLAKVAYPLQAAGCRLSGPSSPGLCLSASLVILATTSSRPKV